VTNELCDRLRSLKLGYKLSSNILSKSLNLHEDKSSSFISDNFLPPNLDSSISSVNLPAKVSLASECSYCSIDIPSSTLSFLKWNIQYIL
jgi:hypothetical protein